MKKIPISERRNFLDRVYSYILATDRKIISEFTIEEVIEHMNSLKEREYNEATLSLDSKPITK